VLFSEPKIPQPRGKLARYTDPATFQCSSASRKFLNTFGILDRFTCTFSFSALQRAENSSTGSDAIRAAAAIAFQCSSASRKFLNGSDAIRAAAAIAFQCSSASRKFLNLRGRSRGEWNAEFQCSSASRKFLNRAGSQRVPGTRAVSVLFSEPKIPQHARRSATFAAVTRFSALQRAENSST